MMVEDQLTLGMFVVASTPLRDSRCDGGSAVTLILTPKVFDVQKKYVMNGKKMVGYISPLHDMILRACESLAKKGVVKFQLLDLVVEFESMFPGEGYLETTLAARLRELCQWKLVGREGGDASRSGVYVFYGGIRNV